MTAVLEAPVTETKLTAAEASVNVERAKASGNPAAVERAQRVYRSAKERERRASLRLVPVVETPVVEQTAPATQSDDFRTKLAMMQMGDLLDFARIQYGAKLSRGIKKETMIERIVELEANTRSFVAPVVETVEAPVVEALVETVVETPVVETFPIGQSVRLKGSDRVGVVVKHYAEKIAIEFNGRVVEWYPSELEAVETPVVAIVEETPVAETPVETSVVADEETIVVVSLEEQQREIAAQTIAVTTETTAPVTTDDQNDDDEQTSDDDIYAKRRTNRATGAKMAYGEAARAGFDATGGKWVAVCLTHSAVLNVATRRKARYALAAADFCEECQKMKSAK